MTTPFEGFPPGKSRHINLPELFFSDVLPVIDDIAELKVVLFCFWALPQKEGNFRYLTWEDFSDSEILQNALKSDEPQTNFDDMLETGIQRAIQHNVLLSATVQLETGESKELYFVNTLKGRNAVQQIQAGKWKPSPEKETEIEILPPRPNLFGLYEENIGALTPHIADRIKDAENDFGEEWVTEAIKLAVENNKRSWQYISAILKRWKEEGKTREITERDALRSGGNYTGKYGDFIKS